MTKKLILALALVLALHGSAFASEAGQQIVEELMAGNALFVRGDKGQQPRIDEKRRAELVPGQSPKAIVLSCSDSRVPPEHVFRQGLGDVFVSRVAGNVPLVGEIASIEYAVEHLRTPVLFVLGHTSCGAVKATVATDAAGSFDGLTPSLVELVKEILPAVAEGKAAVHEHGGDLLTESIHANARLAADHLLERSAVVREAFEAGELTIVVGIYDLSTGAVTLQPFGHE